MAGQGAGSVSCECMPLLTRSIAGLLASPSLAPTKLDELKIKANILSAFAAKKAEDATEAAKDKAGQVAEGVEAFAAMMEEKAGKVLGEL
jgi:protein disulfide-isomerase A6